MTVVAIEKRCTTCREIRPAAQFSPDRARRTGLSNRCRPCDNAKSRDYNRRVRNPDVVSHAERRARTAKRKAAERAVRDATPRRCRDCGASIDRRLRICSSCASHIAAMRELHAGHRRRARKYGVPHVYIDRRAICIRDSWRCGICGDGIPRTARYPDPQSASLDHIVPMSLKGPHLPHNVQAAHLRCNLLKGARLAEMDAA